MLLVKMVKVTTKLFLTTSAITLLLSISGIFASSWLLQVLRDFKTLDGPPLAPKTPASLPYHTIGLSPVAAPQDSKSALPTQFTVEVAVFRDEAKAKALVRQLSDKDIDSFYTPLNRRGQVIYRVRSGMFSQHAATLAHKKSIVARTRLQAKVRRLQFF